jgi:hypothetical protein
MTEKIFFPDEKLLNHIANVANVASEPSIRQTISLMLG